jgi:hypothetical protein
MSPAHWLNVHCLMPLPPSLEIRLIVDFTSFTAYIVPANFRCHKMRTIANDPFPNGRQSIIHRSDARLRQRQQRNCQLFVHSFHVLWGAICVPTSLMQILSIPKDALSSSCLCGLASAPSVLSCEIDERRYMRGT